MATDIFSQEITHGGSYNVQGAFMTFSGLSGDETAGLAVQSAQYTYTQAVNKFYDLTSNLVYIVGGRTEGSVSISRIVGPARVFQSFYTQYGNVWNAANNNLEFQLITSCNSSAPTTSKIKMNHCFIRSMAGQINVQQPMINENVSLMFLSLSIE